MADRIRVEIASAHLEDKGSSYKSVDLPDAFGNKTEFDYDKYTFGFFSLAAGETNKELDSCEFLFLRSDAEFQVGRGAVENPKYSYKIFMFESGTPDSFWVTNPDSENPVDIQILTVKV